MTAHFMLSFGTNLGRTRSFRVNNVNTAVTDAAMRSAMDNMIESEFIAGPTGSIITRRAASFIEQMVQNRPLE